jgi:pimeloyl-ACP methyl ester carboxylesterase
MKESYLKEKGFYYRTNDFKPGRPILVFVHGVIGSTSSWADYEKIFENKYNVLTYDLRGHGASKKFSHFPDYKIRNFADDLKDLVSSLHISKFVLVGHSMGTLIVLEYIKRYKEDVIASILISPIFNPEKKTASQALRQLLELSPILNLFPFNLKPGRHIDYAKFPNTTEWDIRRLSIDAWNTGVRIYLYCLRHVMATNQEYCLEKIEIPTLFIHGEKDTVAKMENSVVLSKIVRNSEFVIIKGTDHFVILNNAPQVSEIIDSFLKKNQANLKFS